MNQYHRDDEELIPLNFVYIKEMSDGISAGAFQKI